ncbi:hypothetical protein J7L68_05595 [bacterium]|nr:hypothetical protein [bacterium]
MRVLFWYFEKFEWIPSKKTIENAPDGEPGICENAVAAFIHTEPDDEANSSKQVKHLIKQMKWLAGKWETKNVVLHSFAHLGELKSSPEFAQKLIELASQRLESVGYNVILPPFGYFLDIKLDAPGHPLARIYKEFN